MKKILLEIDRQIKEAQIRLAESEDILNDKTKKEYSEAIADMKDIRKKMEYKLEKLNRLHKLMTKVARAPMKINMLERRNQ